MISEELYTRFWFPALIETNGTGWDSIITELDEILLSYDPDYKIQQIKEKFGGLRYYWEPVAIDYDDPAYAEMRRITSQYEEMSLHTCEQCGAEGSPWSIKGWWTTLCDSCYNDRTGGLSQTETGPISKIVGWFQNQYGSTP